MKKVTFLLPIVLLLSFLLGCGDGGDDGVPPAVISGTWVGGGTVRATRVNETSWVNVNETMTLTPRGDNVFHRRAVTEALGTRWVAECQMVYDPMTGDLYFPSGRKFCRLPNFILSVAC